MSGSFPTSSSSWGKGWGCEGVRRHIRGDDGAEPLGKQGGDGWDKCVL